MTPLSVLAWGTAGLYCAATRRHGCGVRLALACAWSCDASTGCNPHACRHGTSGLSAREIRIRGNSGTRERVRDAGPTSGLCPSGVRTRVDARAHLTSGANGASGVRRRFWTGLGWRHRVSRAPRSPSRFLAAPRPTVLSDAAGGGASCVDASAGRARSASGWAWLSDARGWALNGGFLRYRAFVGLCLAQVHLGSRSREKRVPVSYEYVCNSVPPESLVAAWSAPCRLWMKMLRGLDSSGSVYYTLLSLMRATELP